MIKSIVNAAQQIRWPPQLRSSVFAAFLLCISSATAGAATTAWRSLSPVQREALAPLAQQWDALPEIQQNRLLKTARRYPHLTPEQKQRFHSRLTAWSKLTPEQRKAAREKYRAFKKIPAEKREQVKEMVKQDQARKGPQPVSGVPATTSSSPP